MIDSVLVELGSTKMQDRLSELQEWLAPMKKIQSFDEECLPELVTLLKGYNDEALDLPKGLAVTLRIMAHLAVQPKSNYKLEGN